LPVVGITFIEVQIILYTFFMSQYEVIMPKLGESITEATITKWFKHEGDEVEEDDVLLEVATDKVDSEIPSPVAGKIIKINYKENDVVPVGKVIAVISLSGDDIAAGTAPIPASEVVKKEQPAETIKEKKTTEQSKEEEITSDRFYSPLVKTIAKHENIPVQELDKIEGTGQNGRVTKTDLLGYIENRKKPQPQITETPQMPKASVSIGVNDEIVEMDRLRRMTADHMVMSKHTAPHVTSFVEADVTNLVLWRNKVKEEFQKREKVNLTFMPFFIEAAVKTLKDYPQVNASVDGYKIILRKNINIGVAVALPTGNLIVPVIKNADNLNIAGLAKEMNRLAEAARNNKLSPDDVQGGTFTISNFGTFKNSFGTPIINQPQVAILATGSIEKKPAVLETPTGDVIAVRHKMFLSLSYDHRVIDGALGGMFLRKLADYLENFDMEKKI
jgi:2-oxoglutarate dehydrogenase E2 component (dihydrolipoamide succinyltransferase)